MAKYELWYCDPLGNRIQNIFNIKSFEYTKVVGDVGIGKFIVPVQGKVWEQVKPDYRIHIYRQPLNGVSSLDFVCLLQGFEPKTSRNGSQQYILSGEDLNTLIKRRINAYHSEHANSEYDLTTRQAMRVAIGRNLGTFGSNEAARQLDSDYFSIVPFLDDGPDMKKTISFDRLLDALQDWQAASKNQDDEQFFGIVPLTDTTFEANFWTGQLGQDRTSTVFSLEYGNLVEPVLSYDYTDIVSYVYVGGRGEGASRNIEEVENTDRTNLSIWGRREKFRNATFVEIDDTEALNDIGQDELAKHRPKTKLTCRLIDTPSTRFGVDWNYGDRVTINYQGIQAATIIRAVNIKVDDTGKETISARAEIEL